MQVLILSSWYPSIKFPFEGDFIQRQAIAVSLFTPVTIIHVTQYGHNINVIENKIEKTKIDNLTQIIIYFKFKKTGISFFDKIRYNLKYFSVYKKFISNYFRKETIPDLVHVHIPVKAGLIALWIKKKWKIPFIVSENSGHYLKSSIDSFNNKSVYYKRKVTKIFTNADAVTDVSFYNAAILKNLFNVYEISIIRNTVNINHFYFINTPIKKFRFIHVSSLGYQKNIEGILQAFHKLYLLNKNWELVLAGEMTENVQQLIIKLNLQSIISCTGQISYEEVAAQMQQSSAFVLFSRYENFPCVVVEALCCGLPVISSSVAGVPEVINDTNGILVESENEEQLLYALQKMMENYSLYNRIEISKNARQLYNYEIIGKQFVSLYQQILKNNNHKD